MIISRRILYTQVYPSLYGFDRKEKAARLTSGKHVTWKIYLNGILQYSYKIPFFFFFSFMINLITKLHRFDIYAKLDFSILQ